MRPANPPEAHYAFSFRKPPRSGNVINGLGEQAPRRPTPVFHGTGDEILEWSALDRLFIALNRWDAVWKSLQNLWVLRNADGPVARLRKQLSPTDAAALVKSKGKQFGASIVGVTRVTDASVMAGRKVSYGYAIALGFPMNREEMSYVPQARANREVMRSYVESSKTAVRLARFIRSLGWPARAFGLNCNDIQQVPLAINAGLGQLGKHGSLIALDHGSNLRLSSVLTDLPLALDAPIDIGVDDLCIGCQRCRQDCPPDAIFNEKQIVRGAEKWYVNFDKCAPYFTKTWGCGICIEVCPWSEPGRGPQLSKMLLRKRESRPDAELALRSPTSRLDAK